MCQNKQVPITLAIDDTPMVMSVIGFSGHDSLNEPYRFEIDLLSSNPLLDFNELLQRTAYLSLGAQGEGFHGQICSVSQRYAGTDLSHYRVSLTPALQQLRQRHQRRIFHDLSVPQLIVQLLGEHGLDDNAYRFEHTTGLYPPRALCVQHDESDLHLLQRLCEEEGIHFRFEHSRNQHLLIFSDDPASFPEHLQPLYFQGPGGDGSPAVGLSHLSERLWALPGYLCHHDEVEGLGPPLTATQTEWAANQPYPHLAYNPKADANQLRQRQVNARHLQRVRCERYQVDGRSEHTVLASGHIMQVLNHPEAQYNDQWLLTEVKYQGWQPQVLEGCDRYDSARILDSAAPEADDRGYGNSFSAIPWSTPFRPSLKHPKPQIHGYLPAVLGATAEGLLASDTLGRLPIRFDPATDSGCTMAYIGDSALLHASAGTAVWVSHFDNDPDRPVICGLREEPKNPAPVMDRRATVQVDGVRVDPTQPHLHLNRGQRLHIEAHNLSITGPGANAELTSDGIDIRAAHSVRLARLPHAGEPAATNDLRLTEKPGLEGRPLAQRNWYIVRMPKAELSELARLDPRHFLFEGQTDDQGYLGLSPDQQRQLAEEYQKTPHHLCLIHPGQCLPLKLYFQQNWSEQKLRLFSSP